MLDVGLSGLSLHIIPVDQYIVHFILFIVTIIVLKNILTAFLNFAMFNMVIGDSC